jgi:hypothetical protein
MGITLLEPLAAKRDSHVRIRAATGLGVARLAWRRP